MSFVLPAVGGWLAWGISALALVFTIWLWRRSFPWPICGLSAFVALIAALIGDGILSDRLLLLPHGIRQEGRSFFIERTDYWPLQELKAVGLQPIVGTTNFSLEKWFFHYQDGTVRIHQSGDLWRRHYREIIQYLQQAGVPVRLESQAVPSRQFENPNMKQYRNVFENSPIWLRYGLAGFLVSYCLASIWGRIDLRFGAKIFSQVAPQHIRTDIWHIVMYTIIPVLLTTYYLSLFAD